MKEWIQVLQQIKFTARKMKKRNERRPRNRKSKKVRGSEQE